MLNGKYVSVDSIIERVRRKGLSDFNKMEVVEWLWDAIGIFGIPDALQDKIEDIHITSFKGLLPIDIYDTTNILVREKTAGVALIHMTNGFYLNQNPNSNAVGNVVTNVEGETIIANPNVTVPPTINEVTISQYLTSQKREEFSFLIKGDYLFCGFEEGDIEITYKAFPLADDKMPAIPDDAKYIRAIVAYISLQVAQRLKLKNLIARDDLEMLDREYSFAVGAAITSSRIPSIAEMEAIKRRTLRMFQDIDEFSAGFKYMNTYQNLKVI